MLSLSGPHFLHHHQNDGFWKSVCPACEQLVIADPSEAGLAWIESFHFCESDHLHALTLRPAPTPAFPIR